MKRVILYFLWMVSVSANAQQLESNSDFYTGYLSTTNFDSSNTIKSIDGVLYMIYDDIPIALIKYPAMNPREEFEVPSSVRRICNNAFQGTKFLKTLKIHNTVTNTLYANLKIGESAFNDSSIENFVVIENNGNAATYMPKNTSSERKEVARYDLNGRKVNEDTEGVHIIAYDDKTAKKAMNKK